MPPPLFISSGQMALNIYKICCFLQIIFVLVFFTMAHHIMQATFVVRMRNFVLFCPIFSISLLWPSLSACCNGNLRNYSRCPIGWFSSHNSWMKSNNFFVDIYIFSTQDLYSIDLLIAFHYHEFQCQSKIKCLYLEKSRKRELSQVQVY